MHTVLTDIWGALEPPLIRTLCLPPSCIKFTSACDDSSRSASPLATYLHAPPLLEICSKSHVCMYLSMYYLVKCFGMWSLTEYFLAIDLLEKGQKKIHKLKDQIIRVIPFSANSIYFSFHFLLSLILAHSIFCSFLFLVFPFSAYSFF